MPTYIRSWYCPYLRKTSHIFDWYPRIDASEYHFAGSLYFFCFTINFSITFFVRARAMFKIKQGVGHSNKHGIKYASNCTVYPKKYAHGVCFAVLCCGYTLTDFPISIRLTSLALWQSNDWPSASKATLMNMDKYFMWIHYERLHNHNKAKHNKTVSIFLGIYCKNISFTIEICLLYWLIWHERNLFRMDSTWACIH